MSAIVEGVSMVRHCGECELNKLNWDRCHQILRGCPIIGEMPDKHGRLIDADALENQVAQWRACCKFQDAQILCTVIDMIQKAPTIIEAGGNI